MRSQRTYCNLTPFCLSHVALINMSTAQIQRVDGGVYSYACQRRLNVNLFNVEITGPEESLGSEDEIKQWVWDNCRDTLLQAMTIKCREEPKEYSKEDFESKQPSTEQRLELLDKIAQVQRQYLQREEVRCTAGYTLAILGAKRFNPTPFTSCISVSNLFIWFFLSRVWYLDAY